MEPLGNLFLAIGGFAIGWFVMFAVLCIAGRIYLGFELWCEREPEPVPSDDELGDIPNLDSFHNSQRGTL